MVLQDYLGGVIVLMAIVASLVTATLLPGQVPPALVGLAVNYTLLVPIYLNWVVKFLADVEMYMNDVERVQQYATTPTEDYRTQGVSVPHSWPEKGDIVFENVSLRYDSKREPVVTNLNLHIPPGQKVGICGRTGSGKSSLVMSLFHMVDVYEGSIEIDGIDITQVPLQVLRSRLSIIPQDVIMFSGTIRENLDPRHQYSDEDLWRSLEMAQLKDIVSSYQGCLDGEVREGGENLSAGERQLFCLARAILHDAACLIMDEATSSVDPGTEKALLAAAAKAFANKTVITIAFVKLATPLLEQNMSPIPIHRLPTILECDRIVVLDEGRIAEDGSPAELMNKFKGFHWFHTLVLTVTITSFHRDMERASTERMYYQYISTVSRLTVAPSYPSTPPSDISESEEIWQQVTERERAKIKPFYIRAAVSSAMILDVAINHLVCNELKGEGGAFEFCVTNVAQSMVRGGLSSDPQAPRKFSNILALFVGGGAPKPPATMKFSCFPSIFSDKETWTLESLSSDKRPGSFTKIDPDNRHDDNQSNNGSAFEKVVNGRHVSVFVNNKFSTCPKPPRIAVVDVIKRKASDVDIPFYQKDQSFVRDHMYVSAEGEFEVHKRGQILGTFGPGRVFGELAILYNSQRNASIRGKSRLVHFHFLSRLVLVHLCFLSRLILVYFRFLSRLVSGTLPLLVTSDSGTLPLLVTSGSGTLPLLVTSDSGTLVSEALVWVLEREVFKQIMRISSIQRSQDNIKYLRSVPLLEHLSDKNLAEMSDLLRVKFFVPGTKIVEQDTNGNEFFIISGGSVKITKRIPGSTEEEDLGTLVRGDFFGEQALLHQVLRQATITALSPGVECLKPASGSFFFYHRRLSCSSYPPEYQDIGLKDLLKVGTLGVGGFGRVELVQYKRDKKLTFAIKCLKKYYVVEQQQEDHAYNEKTVMLECAECPFIARLYRTYRDTKYIYFLMEACLGGDVFTVLQKHKKFQDNTARFMVACVVEALVFLHDRGFIYRDLKPENLLIDSTGYIKMTDFGFAKRIGTSGKTWTFAGTPEYVAPEIILNRGHDRSVDYWALGVLIYELLSGSPPFRGTDHLKTYGLILKGIESVKGFPKEITKEAKGLIRKLCRVVPTERLGYQKNGIVDIKNHKWFNDFDWEALKQRSLPAPIVQPVKSNTDTSNFDKYEREKEIPPDEISGWDKDF
uniref:cGMP-dependent protein kinase n=1 Tax=Timema monikensis TaxID=170555 RepID=A0A7R9EFS8_9NEOP|nr:unnamed protein product [Timema monikensis]